MRGVRKPTNYIPRTERSSSNRPVLQADVVSTPIDEEGMLVSEASSIESGRRRKYRGYPETKQNARDTVFR